MKRVATYTFLLTLIFQLQIEKAEAQPVSDSLLLNSPIYREKLHLFTDRSLYASGEIIHFRLHNKSHDLLKENSWSTVLYLELIGNHNIPVAQGKYQLDPKGATGQLLIPDTVSTGAYHLRAYTKWMRNFDASDYFHLPLTVVNPQKINRSEMPKFDSTQAAITNPLTSHEVVSCSLERVSYGNREKVTLQINLEDTASLKKGYCVSVIKKGYLDLDFSYTPHGDIEDQIKTGEVLFYPETRGISLSGRAIRDSDSTPMAYTPVHITLLGPESDYFGTVTDKFGRIQFSIPSVTSPTELLITSSSKSGEVIDLILQDEFSQDFTMPSFTPSNVLNIRQSLVNEMGTYSQVAKPFITSGADVTSTEEKQSEYSFYGTPEFRYKTADYIEIPNLEEFIFELVPKVQVEKQNRQKYFSVIDDAGPISEFAPLILLDFVPIPYVEAILSLAPEQIEYIDIINTIYIRGSTNYGGIISIVSKKGDLAGIKLPEGSSILTFNPLNKMEEMKFIDYDHQKFSKRIPDLRTTLHWSAQNKFLSGRQNTIEFFTSDVSGEFIAVIRGMTKKGTIVQGTCEFTVK